MRKLQELLTKWKEIGDLTPSSSTIFVGERNGILRCATELEKVLSEMNIDMDPHNTSADRPKFVPQPDRFD